MSKSIVNKHKIKNNILRYSESKAKEAEDIQILGKKPNTITNYVNSKYAANNKLAQVLKDNIS